MRLVNETGTGGGGGWSLLTVASGEVNAHLIRGRLTEEGIESLLDRSNLAPGAWLHPFGNPSAPVKILVRASQLEWAQLLFSQAENDRPRSGSVMRRRGLGAAVMIAITFMVAVLLGLGEILGAPSCALDLFC